MERYMILIRTDGTGRLIRCDDGDTCKLETLQQLVGGLIETADSCLEPGWAREPVDSIKLIVNEEGLLQELPVNWKPSIIIKRTETQTSRLCVFSLLQPHRTEVRLTGKYRYLTFEDRKKIEAWHLLGDRPVDIAARLSVHHTTIYKELQRGATGALDANQREGYSAELAERRLRESFKRRGKRAPAAQ